MLYVAVQLVAQGLLGPALVDEGVAPLATAAGSAYGPLARTIMLAAAVASMFGNLCGAMLAGPRSIFALGRDSFLPARAGRGAPGPSHAARRHRRLCGRGAGARAEWHASSSSRSSSTSPACSVYFVVALAAWRLRVAGVRLEGEPFGLPGGPLVPLLACAAIGAVIVATVSMVEVAAMAAAIAVATATLRGPLASLPDRGGGAG